MSKIDKFKEQIRAKAEKEIYKSSIHVTVKYTVGDGGEYTKDEAEVMAHLYNNDMEINIPWLINDIKRTYALNSLKEKGVLNNPSIARGAYSFNVDKKAIKRTKHITHEIDKRNENSSLSIEEMNEIDRLLRGK